MALENGVTPSGVRRKLSAGPLSSGDKWFFRVTAIASNFAFVLVALIVVFLFVKAWPVISAQGFSFVTGSIWNPDGKGGVMQLGPMLWGSLLIGFTGIILATPMAISAAYLIVYLLPKSLARIATTIVDLLAALPSVVIGLWGFMVFTPVAINWGRLANKFLGWIPFFQVKDPNSAFTDSPFIAGWIVAVMIVPIITSVTREIFSQMDDGLINGALALGGSRASVFRKVILPTSSSGIIGAILLGLGRALGETVAIAYVLQLSMKINFFNLLESRGGAVASWILTRFGEASSKEFTGLMAAGLVIFIVTLIVNTLATFIVNRAQPWRKN
jgi:phosphate transport system permease protein